MLTVTLVSLVPGVTAAAIPVHQGHLPTQLRPFSPPHRLFVTCFPSQQLRQLPSSPFLNYKLPALQTGQVRRRLGDR